MDFEKYIAEHPGSSVIEMDTVYNDVSNSPFVKTLQFVKHHIMKDIFHKAKTSKRNVRRCI